MQWIEDNLSSEYQQCLPIIKRHNIDGKLLKDCLRNDNAKSGLLKTLFPDSKDTFLRLSFVRQIQRIDSNPDTQDAAVSNVEKNTILQINGKNVSSSTSSNRCTFCGAAISVFMLENHQRHCGKQRRLEQEQVDWSHEVNVKNEPNDNEQETAMTSPVLQHDPNTDIISTEVQCEFCEMEYNATSIKEHRLYCGSRTDVCTQCGDRDTLLNLQSHTHRCKESDDITNKPMSNVPVRYESYDATISSMERQLYSLERTLCPHLATNQNNISILNQSNGRNGSTNSDVIRTQNVQKFKAILDLMEKILCGLQREKTRSRPLSCSHPKIRDLICCYSPCAEFLTLCGFVFVSRGGKSGDDVYLWTNGDVQISDIALNVVGRKRKEFEEKVGNYREWQSQWERKQAFTKKGRWCCKKCDHLNNKKHWKCLHCKTKRKVSRHSQKRTFQSMNAVESWVCAMCKYRNKWTGNKAKDDVQCQNCQTHKIVTDLSQEPPLKRSRIF